jgi:hypothetical protein
MVHERRVPEPDLADDLGVAVQRLLALLPFFERQGREPRPLRLRTLDRIRQRTTPFSNFPENIVIFRRLPGGEAIDGAPLDA